MKAIWRGSITFGLVSIPVKLYNARVSREISFHMLHSSDGGRIRFKKVCEKCGKEVSKNEIVKGYEISKNEYVILTDEDLEKLPLRSAKEVRVLQFFDPSELSVIYYGSMYYVSPDKGGVKAYTLLRKAMEDTGSMGLGKLTMRGKEYLVGLKAFGDGILLAQLYYVDEIRSPYEVPNWGAKEEYSEEELELAKQLVLAMKKPLRLEEYRNEYYEALMQLIEAKLAGHEVKVAEEVETAKSLVEALRESLEAVK